MLVKVDAKGLEWYTIAWLSNDPIALREINEGIDTHGENQSHFGLPTRLIAKRYLFRTIFRGSGWAFAKDPDFAVVSSDPDYWDDINRKFFLKYKGIDRCHTQWAQLVVSKKPIVSPLGREWMIPPRDDGKIPWTTLTNYPVQGTGADVVMIARISLKRRLANCRSLMICTVHDDIVLDCPDEEVDYVVNTSYEVFNDVSDNIERIWKIKMPLRFKGEVYVGKNLKDMEPREYNKH